jgi:transposase-like protein
MARPSKFTPEVTETIIKALQIGATYKDAAEAAGVDYDTYNEWIKAGKAAKSGKFFEFSELVKRTEAQARLNYLSTIAQAAAKGDWKAAEAYLKRRDRANWGDAVDVTTGGEALTIKIIKASDDTDANQDK